MVYFESLRVPGLGFEDLMRYMRGVEKGNIGCLTYSWLVDRALRERLGAVGKVLKRMD